MANYEVDCFILCCELNCVVGQDPSTTHELEFFVADDLQDAAVARRVRRVFLRLTVDNLCSEDLLGMELNGTSLHEGDVGVVRGYGQHIAIWDFDASSANLRRLASDSEAEGWGARTATRAPDSGGPGLAMTVEVELRSAGARPKKGLNRLGLCLVSRPDGLVGGVVLHSVSVEIDYGAHYPGDGLAKM